VLRKKISQFIDKFG